MKSIQDKIEQLEKELAELKQEVDSRNNHYTTINSVEDAFNLLKPEWWINEYGKIDHFQVSIFNNNKCNMTSEKRAKQIKALIQLHLIAEAMNMGVEKGDFTNWHFINRVLSLGEIVVGSSFNDLIPTFNTLELAEQALEKFKPLFMDLYMLND